MKRIFCFQLTLVACAISIFSGLAKAEDDFTPVFAADQPRITVDTIVYEREQLHAYGYWKAQKVNLETEILRRDLFSKQLARLVELAKTGKASKYEVDATRLNLQNSQGKIANLISDIGRQKSLAYVRQYRLLEEGNPGSDYRKQIAEAIMIAAKADIDSFQKTLETSLSVQAFLKNFFENGKKLYKKNVISLTDLESREIEVETIARNIGALQHQVAAAKIALEGLKKSHSRL